MSSETLFQIHLVFGYVAWLLCFSVYLWPWLKAANRFDAQRAIATLHSFRFFGLVFIRVASVPICPLASPPSPRTGISQPECWPFWRFSR